MSKHQSTVQSWTSLLLNSVWSAHHYKERTQFSSRKKLGQVESQAACLREEGNCLHFSFWSAWAEKKQSGVLSLKSRCPFTGRLPVSSQSTHHCNYQKSMCKSSTAGSSRIFMANGETVAIRLCLWRVMNNTPRVSPLQTLIVLRRWTLLESINKKPIVLRFIKLRRAGISERITPQIVHFFMPRYTLDKRGQEYTETLQYRKNINTG